MTRQIRVRAFPDAKKEFVQEEEPGKLKIFVREPPKKNMANRRITQLVAEYADVNIKNVVFLVGHKSPNKLFEIRDLD